MYMVFKEPLVRRLMEWAEHGEEPLRTYAVGLLAGAMDVQDVVVKFKDFNGVLVNTSKSCCTDFSVV